MRLKNKETEDGDAFDASLRIVNYCLSDIVRGFKSAATKKIEKAAITISLGSRGFTIELSATKRSCITTENIFPKTRRSGKLKRKKKRIFAIFNEMTIEPTTELIRKSLD